MSQKAPIKILILDGSNRLWSPLIGALLTQAQEMPCTPERINRFVIETAGIYDTVSDEADAPGDAVRYGLPAADDAIDIGDEMGINLHAHRSRRIDHAQIKESALDLIIVCEDRRICDFLHQFRIEGEFETPILFFDCEEPRYSLIRESQAHVESFAEWMKDQAPNLLKQIDMLLPFNR